MHPILASSVRLLLPLWLGILLSSCGGPPLLQSGTALDTALPPGQVGVYHLDLEAGQFLDLKVDQVELDVVLKLFDPDGDQIGETVDYGYVGQEELLLAVAETSGRYRLEVGKYESQREKEQPLRFVLLPRLKAAGPSERAAADAFWLFTRGINLAYGERDCEGAIDALSAAAAAETPFLVVTARSLTEIGICHDNLGHSDFALQNLQAALRLVRESTLERVVADVLIPLGRVERKQGLFQDALRHVGEAKDISERLGYDRGMALSLQQLCNLNCEMGLLEEAEAQCRDTVAFAEKTGYRASEAHARNALAWALQFLGRPEESITELMKGLELAPKQSESQANIILNLARAFDAVGEEAKAVEYFGRAKELNRSLKRTLSMAHTQTSLARVLLDADRVDSARAEIDSALDLVSETGGLSRAQVYEVRSRIAFAEGKVDQAKADIDEAFALIESTRPNALDFKARAKLLAAKWRIYEQRIFLAMKRSPFEGLQAAEQARARSLVDSLARSTGEQVSSVLSVREVQEDVLGPDTALIQFFLGSRESYIWIVTRERLTALELPSRKTLNQAAQNVSRRLTAPATAQDAVDTRAAAAELAHALRLGEAVDGLTASKLLIVPDGGLHQVPFSALPLSGADPDYLVIDRFELTYSPSATVLAAYRHSPNPSGRGSALAVIADPVLGHSDPRLGGKSISNAAAEAMPRLSQTAEEARALAELAGPDTTRILMGFDASKATLAALDLSRYRYLHFATHGVVDLQNPERTSLALSWYDADGLPVDGRLTVEDIEAMRLQADLVVLSACRTARGEHLFGEGLMGLGRAFMNAGVPRVVASLWTVQDSVTRELMEDFYRKMLNDGMRPAAALRASQLELRKYRPDPYHWAAFVFQGEWQ